ncbi:MAG: molecular chaperone [Betaproteobacteria bacterium]|nr:molecular chaperone [Betaproteobacteria bacterium]
MNTLNSPCKPLIRLKGISAFSALFLATLMPLAEAGVFSVTPVRIHMTPKDRAVAVTLVNEGDSPIVLQADLNQWSQKPDGTDVLVLSEDLILAPPIIKLAPKGRQVVRLALLRPADASQQLTYRLIIREIPEASAPKNNIQVPIALALSMPVFITPPPAVRAITCSATRDASGVSATCANGGSAYAQIREIFLKRGDKVEASFEGGPYLLPGARKVIPLKAQQTVAAGAAQMVVSFDDAKTQSFDVVLP